MATSCFCSSAIASEEKREAINELLDISGINRLGEEMINHSVERYIEAHKSSLPTKPKRFYEIIEEERKAFIQEDLYEKKTLYKYLYFECDKKLSLDEVRELLAFYKTPLGKKTLSIHSIIYSEGISVSYAWYDSRLTILTRRLRERLSQVDIQY